MKLLMELEFNEISGETQITVEVIDDTLSNLERNEEIRSGKMLNTVLKEISKVFGSEIANRVKDGSLKAICLDNHPELKKDKDGILVSSENKNESGKIILNQ